MTFRQVIRSLLLGSLSDRNYDAIMYLRAFHRPLNINHPQTFNEKLQWLKLFGGTERYTNLADKFAVREYVTEKIGSQYLNELYGVYENETEINYDLLPSSFVLKATHGSSMNIICKDKRNFDIKSANRQLRRWLRSNFYRYHREPIYKNIHPRIICERLLEDEESKPPLIYRLWCFDGRVEFIHVVNFQHARHTRNIYDRNWRFQPFEYDKHPFSPRADGQPAELGRMIDISEKLAQDIIFVRVDLYYVKSRILFGELTFFPGAGFAIFSPSDWDYRIGAYLHLPVSKQKEISTEQIAGQ